jgi:hypothetical protein
MLARTTQERGNIMNHHKCILLIVLFIIVRLSIAGAGELEIPSSEGSEILSAPVSDPSNTVPVSDPSKVPPDKWRKISEKCIANCDEEKAISKSPSKLPIKKDIKKSEVIRFKTFDVDHSEVKGHVLGSSDPLAGGLLRATVISKIERCAYVVFRNNRGGQRVIREWDFKATFANGTTQEGKTIEANSYRIEEGETGTANICFGINDYPIVGMDCNF